MKFLNQEKIFCHLNIHCLPEMESSRPL